MSGVMVAVFDIRIRDARTQQMIIADHKRTRQGAALLSAEIIEETAEEMDVADIDGQGRYVPR